jgi:hypothetical protein
LMWQALADFEAHQFRCRQGLYARQWRLLTIGAAVTRAADERRLLTGGPRLSPFLAPRWPFALLCEELTTCNQKIPRAPCMSELRGLKIKCARSYTPHRFEKRLCNRMCTRLSSASANSGWRIGIGICDLRPRAGRSRRFLGLRAATNEVASEIDRSD